MTVAELKNALGAHPDLVVRWRLPDGQLVPEHAHVTEVARFDKRFIDCGGTFRTELLCRLQTWVADDVHHRLTAGRLLAILQKARPVLETDQLPVDIEHEAGLISQYPVTRAEVSATELTFHTETRHTACLAEDQCRRPAPAGGPAASPLNIQFRPR